MDGRIYLVKSDETLAPMDQQPYDSEDLLQTLLEKYPDLLAGDQMDRAEPRRWLLISREVGVPGEEDGSGRWSLDHLFLDQSAVPTLVEVKRSTDTRIRREVVGQMLDYAANGIAYWSVERLRASFEENCRTRGTDPESVITDFLAGTENPEPDIEGFWKSVQTNLHAHRIRLVFVADQIPTELRRIVEFLNKEMRSAEVLAVEIRQYVGQGVRTLVPTVVGATAKSDSSITAEGWTKQRFLAKLCEAGANLPAVAEAVHAWIEPKAADVWWGKGKVHGSFVPSMRLEHGRPCCSLFACRTQGDIQVYFQVLAARPPFSDDAKRAELRDRLNRIPGVNIPADRLRHYPSVPLAALSSDPALRQFEQVMEWVISEIRAADAGQGTEAAP